MSSSSDAVTTGQKNASTKATIHYPFWFGGSASCFAACVTHPLDLGEWTRLRKQYRIAELTSSQ
ncbi:hypothetical protein P152DRAFT_396742 [Eremomyces bilateralis CBS 781.70]|uniref:Uncharacterized protein n=1 Tax=Eremomyces bilateralis CBS 781.70 TaxID=1392243 RepID=A0A6G1G412_9PEZI|nr:uncharacterized protein P152DRAFT_396742 [Eremomyces bilateralis CBS 781.70]KAF1812646.1 hypothetical protein P152DRAFT_396742 [Eremomyces bilateralis CBS 781.70]